MDLLNLSTEELKKMKKTDLMNEVEKLKSSLQAEDIIKKGSLERIMTDLKDIKEQLFCVQELKAEINHMKNQLSEVLKENEQLKEQLKANNNKQLEDIERHCFDNIQYVRRNNIEISNIPEIFDDQLENKVIEICNLYGVNVTGNDIEACHRLRRNNRSSHPPKTIVRFVNRRNVGNLMSNKKMAVDLSQLGFPENGRVYFNDNL